MDVPFTNTTPATQLLVSYPYLDLYLHTRAAPALEARWRGFVSSAVLRQVVAETLVLARQHRIRGWIADDRLLGPVRPTDLEWIVTEMLPALVKFGVKRLARIEAEDPMNQLLIGSAQETVQPTLPLEIRVFSDLPAARVWATG
jgi:hypothetical protein